MNRRLSLWLIAVIWLGTGVGLSAEKLTTVAVIDLEKIYQAITFQSKAVRDFEQAKQNIQQELNNHIADLGQLRNQRSEAQARNDLAMVQKLDYDIAQKSQFITEFQTSKQAELEKMKQDLSSSNEFKQDLDAAIEYVAIAEGYTVVLLSGMTTNLYWWSSEVDISQKVINRLKQNPKYRS